VRTKNFMSTSQQSLVEFEKKSLKKIVSKRDVRIRKRLLNKDKPSRPTSGRSNLSSSSRYAATTALGFT